MKLLFPLPVTPTTAITQVLVDILEEELELGAKARPCIAPKTREWDNS